jgi:hypothetical protein
VLRAGEPADGTSTSAPASLDALWQAAHDRLAALPASRRLADAPIAGLAVSEATPC